MQYVYPNNDDNIRLNPSYVASYLSSEPHLFARGYLNDHVHDLNLSKRQTEILGFRLKGLNPYHEEWNICVFKRRHSEFTDLFSFKDGLYLVCLLCYRSTWP